MAVGVAALALVTVTSATSEARELKPTYGECTYGCDIMHRRCLQNEGKLGEGFGKCQREYRQCKARCDAIRDEEIEHFKPKRP
jgi:hypothetical protein